MTVGEAKPLALVGCALGFALGSWNFTSFWLNPRRRHAHRVCADVRQLGCGRFRRGAPHRAADRCGQSGRVFAFSTFAIFWIANIARVNFSLDVLRDWPDWQQTVVARYRQSGFKSFQAFTNYDYLKDAPLKLNVPTAIGAMLASIGGLAGLLGQRSKLSPERP